MKQSVTQVKDLNIVLGDMEPWVKDPKVLYNGKPGNFKLLPREVLANWLLCAVGNAHDKDKSFTFCNDPFGGGDGIIIDKNTGDQMVTEHVFVPKQQKTQHAVTEDLIIQALQCKQNKGGKSYAQGKHLIIFCDGLGEWHPNKVGREIEGKHDFSSAWGIGLERAEGDIYAYWVVHFNKDHSPAVRVEIDFKAKSWSISQIQ